MDIKNYILLGKVAYATLTLIKGALIGRRQLTERWDGFINRLSKFQIEFRS